MSRSATNLQNKIIHVLENSPDHIFITGNAGTGKTTLIDKFRKKTKQQVAVLAPTGVAAVNISGETIHSFFGFPPGITPNSAKDEALRTRKKKIFQALETLIIDEISMVRADLFDSIDTFLRIVRKINLPFGGIKMVLVGDLFQLPPVVTNVDRAAIESLYQTPFFFSSQVFQQILGGLYPQIKFIELTKIYRQTEKNFVEMLGRIRNMITTQADIDRLNNQIVLDNEAIDAHIVLTATNEQANKINTSRLDAIPGPAYIFKSERTGHFSDQYAPAEDIITIKTGSRVMLLNNDPQDRWINGSLGRLYRVDGNTAYVKLDDGNLEKVEPVTWSSFRTVFNQKTQSLETEVVGSFKQLPIRLAWAITIHKSQGKTFDKVAIDLGNGAFAHGQTYVALSRCTTFSGIKLLRPIHQSSIIVDKRVGDFLHQLRQLAG